MVKKKTLALSLAILMMSVSNIAHADTKSVSEKKLAGTNRYKTAIEVSKAGWSSADKAILVNGTALADALCVAPLADEYNAPILLTEKDNLNADTLNELTRLGVKEVTIIGGNAVVSPSQEATLKANGMSTKRIYGNSRYETSLKIAEVLKPIYQAKGGRKTVFLANGVKGLADATSVSSPAGIKDAVILYTNGTNLDGIKSYIASSVDDVYLIGGTSVISQGIENELKSTTNKGIYRIAGSNRKDTNAKVVDKFFTQKELNNMYFAKDGMGKENELVDALAVGALASKTKSPVILASGDLDNAQRNVIGSKDVSTVTQVGEGRNATAYKQGVGILNKVVVNDGMKLPTLNLAKEGNMKFPRKTGGALGSIPVKGNVIEGDLYVKYGDTKLNPHTYGSKNQKEYDMVVNWAKQTISEVDFRLEPDWVYLQHYYNGGKADDFIDPILLKNGITVKYGIWKNTNKYMINGLNRGLISRADAEELAMFNSVVSYASAKVGKTTNPGDASPYSAKNFIYDKLEDCDSTAQFCLLISDILGCNGGVFGTYGHQDFHLLPKNGGSYSANWWVNGRTPTLKKTQNPFKVYENVIEAPTYNIEHLYK